MIQTGDVREFFPKTELQAQVKSDKIAEKFVDARLVAHTKPGRENYYFKFSLKNSYFR